MLKSRVSNKGTVKSISIQGDSLKEKMERDYIAYLIEIGKAIEESPHYDYENIQNVIDGKKTLDELTFLEDIVWTALILEKMNNPSNIGKSFFAERKRQGLGVGLDENDILVSQRELNEQQILSMDLN